MRGEYVRCHFSTLPDTRPEQSVGAFFVALRISMRVPAEVIQIAIDDALSQASPFYEAMARPHIPALDQAIELALTNEGYAIIPISEIERLKIIEAQVVKEKLK